jgi:hypothetical protein
MQPWIRLLAAGLLVIAQASLAGDKAQAIPSPDGRFCFEIAAADDDNPFGIARITSKETGKAVWETPEEVRNSFTKDSRCVWSPDSKKFALNYRAGGRYETTDIFRWDGRVFGPSPSIEEVFASRLDAAKEKQLRKLVDTLPADFPGKKALLDGANQRRNWDNFTVRRWIDGNTLEATGYSISFVAPGIEDNDGEDISGALRLVLRFDERWRCKILEEQAISLEGAGGTPEE